MYRHPAAVLVFVLGTLSAGWMAETILSSQALTSPFVSALAWQGTVAWAGGRVDPQRSLADAPVAEFTNGGPFVWVGAIAVVLLFGGAAGLIAAGASFPDAIVAWGLRGWRWGLLAAGWCGLWSLALAQGWVDALTVLSTGAPLWVALMVNLWAAEWFALRRTAPWRTPPACEMTSGAGETSKPDASSRHAGSVPHDGSSRLALFVAVAAYAFTFTAMNWGLWFNLQIPHGDSAMYEEHLWNVEHGKGFRSYLDQGLFLGEHLQVIHLLLVPLHLLWPSHLLLELCQSLALACTAIPLYSITRRHTGSPRAALYLALACLLYFPLQSLDISIDLKTFRPTAFAIPLLLAAIDQMERGRWKTMGLLLLITLSAQEDLAIPIAMLGLWIAATGSLRPRGLPDALVTLDPHQAKSTLALRLAGLGLFLVAAAYLLFAVKVAIPWFRGGDTPHFAGYFSAFGHAPLEIARNMVTQPGLLAQKLFTASNVLLAAYLLVPLGLLPILSPGRLAVGAPLFLLLCLNELAQNPPGPFHHFHAPLVPILLWAAATGLANVVRWSRDSACVVCGARFALGCALVSGACYTLSPLGTKFWDPGRVIAERPTCWRSLYLPDERARRWADVAPLIPPSAHVASTDFVHPRLTHCDRSYDYSRYVRKVAGYADRVPDDTDYIVLDLRHPYSRSVLGAIRSAADVRELQMAPDRWRLLTSPTDGYFVVLQRAPANAAPE